MHIKDKLMKMKAARGFTLVELMIVVAIIGVLAALAIYGVSKYLANAKTAEARMALGRIGKDAQTAWERESMSGSVLSLGSSAQNSHALCGDAAPIPATVPSNAKYQSSPADWSGDAGWRCLKFTMDGPQYFQYQYTTTGSGATATFAALAHADLNGNGVASTFTLNGAVQSASGELLLTIAPQLVENLPEE